MKKPTCENCPFFRITRTGAFGAMGECRRMPPVWVPPEHTKKCGEGQLAVWPETLHHHWCGEHPRYRDYDHYIAGRNASDREHREREKEAIRLRRGLPALGHLVEYRADEPRKPARPKARKPAAKKAATVKKRQPRKVV